MSLFSVAVIGIGCFFALLNLAVREHDRQERIKRKKQQ